ncbi:MAG: glycosyltransferase family 4 protein [Planctomycetes bacterium]|nr:glycosyltransferase family 4 protein [Planctomycetota bacterium]
MRIAFIGHKGTPAKYGGIERWVEEVAVRLAERGHKVTSFARSHYSDSVKNYRGIEIVRLPSIRTKSLENPTHTMLSTLCATFRGFDVLHFQNVGPSVFALLPWLLRRKIVVTVHALDQRQAKWSGLGAKFLAIGERTAYGFASKTTSVSKTIAGYYRDSFRKTIVPLHPGIDPDGEIDETVLGKFGLRPGGYVLSVGRIIRDKNFLNLIEAHRRAETGLKLVIAGDADESEREHLESLRRAAGTDVVFTGFAYEKQLRALYRGCKLYVHPSKQEGLSLSILEAIAQSRCVLASLTPENFEALTGESFEALADSASEDEKRAAASLAGTLNLEGMFDLPGGFAFAPNDVDALASALKILSRAETTVSEKGASAKLFALRTYSWDTLVDSLEQIYRSI